MEEPQERDDPIEYQYVHRRAGHVMVAYQGRLVVWGGYMELPHRQSYTYMTPSQTFYHSAINVWVFDPMLDKWTKRMSRGDIPPQLCGSCAAVHDQHMYLFGGWASTLDTDLERSLDLLWRLHLPTMTWTLLEPSGTPPFPCDKAACWVYNNRFYVFGGFGPATNLDEMREMGVNFVADNVYNSGWVDHLVYYDIDKNEWVWPKTTGRKPIPRAAHAADVSGDKVYIFGGRNQSERMNELHCLDLNKHVWSGNLTEGKIEDVPEGRSWHTFKFVSENKAVMYGGFNSTQQVLKDIWVVDVRSNKWKEIISYRAGLRLWHTAAVTHPGEITFFGGIRNNLLDNTVAKDHAEDMLVLRFSPQSLKRLAVEKVCSLGKPYYLECKILPQSLTHILTTRLSHTTIN